jgi:hypothetical protein
MKPEIDDVYQAIDDVDRVIADVDRTIADEDQAFDYEFRPIDDKFRSKEDRFRSKADLARPISCRVASNVGLDVSIACLDRPTQARDRDIQARIVSVHDLDV